MVPNVIERVWVQGTTTKVESLRGTAFTEEDGAHTFRIAGVDASGETVPLSGTVLAKILRADNITIDVSGTITDGVASVTMVGDCYHVPGRFSIVVYLSDGVTTIAIYAAVGDIYRATSDTELDSGTTVPSLAQLEAAYQNALSAAAAANTAATGAERVNVSMSKSGDTITFSATDRTGATTTETMSDQSEAVANLNSAIDSMTTATASDEGKALKVKTVSGGKVTEWEFGEAGGSAGIEDTATGDDITVDSIAGVPKSLVVGFEWSQGDISNISTENPVPISTMKTCTLTVNEDDTEQSFTYVAGAAGIGKGSWNVLSGAVNVVQKAVVVTADMVTSLAYVSGELYAAKLNLGTPVYSDGGGILACSHYEIGKNPGIWLRNGTLYLYGQFANDLAAVKSFVAGLNMVVVFAIQTPESLTVTPLTVSLLDGENTLSVDVGTMTLTYEKDLQDYVESAVEEVAEVANNALEVAQGAALHGNALQASVDTIKDDVYKYRTETGANTGTGSAETSTHIHWGVFVNVNPLVEKCRSITMTPVCSNDTAGTYTATRWKNASGNALVDGEILTVVETKTANKGESVTFDYVGIGEFISVAFSSGSTRRTSDDSEKGLEKAHIGYVDPETGAYTQFSGCLSGSFTIVIYKVIAGDCMTLFGKRITLVGDSITEKNGRANVNHGMWLERWTGCIIQNLGVGGTGFARTPGSTNYKTRISRVDASADIIGVAASFNDMTYTLGTPTDTASDNTICGYANEFFDTLIGLYPTKRIVCYSEGPWYNYHPGVTASDNYMSAMKTICENKGVVWDDGLYRGCALRPWLQDNCEVYYKGESGSYTDVVDNIHPNSAGQEIIARWLEKLFEKVVD